MEPRCSSVAVIGRLADMANTGDHGSSDVRSPAVVTPFEGLRAALPGVRDQPRAGGRSRPGGRRGAGGRRRRRSWSGYTAEDEGEYIDNEAFGDPDLLAVFPPFPDDPALQRRLEGLLTGEGGAIDRGQRRRRAETASAFVSGRSMPTSSVPWPRPIARTVVAIITAGAVITEEWRDAVPAVSLSWYSGSEGGHALADVLLGHVDASGAPALLGPGDRGPSPLLRPQREGHHLRQVVRPAPARPGRAHGGLPSRVRAVVHGVRALRAVGRRARGRLLPRRCDGDEHRTAGRSPRGAALRQARGRRRLSRSCPARIRIRRAGARSRSPRGGGRVDTTAPALDR